MKTTNDAHATPTSSSVRHVAVASTIGCVLEWYDFFLYGFAASLVFGALFFPNMSEVAGTLAALGTFLVGFIARPVGGIIFGHFGDRLGRKRMLVLTIGIMGTASLMIGLLPTAGQIGIAAPFILIAIRFAQGVALGGEWGGAVLIVTESSPSGRRGFWGSVVQLGAPIGNALAIFAMFGGYVALGSEQFLAWGWRIPFLASTLLLAIGLFIRLRINESPVFADMTKRDTVHKFPLLALFKNHSKSVVLCFVMYTAIITVPFFIHSVFVTGYATNNLGMTPATVLFALGAVNLLVFPLSVISGGLWFDRFGGRSLYLVGSVALAVIALPSLAVLGLGIEGVLLGAGAIGIVQFLCWGGAPAFFGELFPAGVRYSGISLGGQAATIIGGLAPIVSTAAVAATGNRPWPVAAMVAALALTSLLALLSVRKLPQYVERTTPLDTPTVATVRDPSLA